MKKITLLLTLLFLTNFSFSQEKLDDLLQQLQKANVATWEDMQANDRLTTPQASMQTKLSDHTRKIGKDDGTYEPFQTGLAPFYHGVASGDPTSSSIILWTRVTPDGEEDAPITVKWFLATDKALTNIVQEGSYETSMEQDYTVKIDVTELDPASYYYYYFEANDKKSILGRTKTTPTGDIDRLRFGVVSCSHYQQGYFNAYNLLAKHDDLDAVIHLGDYIYEYGVNTDFVDSLIRPFEPADEILTLTDYRTRHSLYKLDTSLMKLHQMHPFITIWDDHETANDAWREGAQNHDAATEGDWDDRKEAGYRSYFEWMPIRDGVAGEARKVQRKISYGDLVDLIMLDTRSMRDQQSDVEEVINATDRTLLGEEQLAWLLDELSNSTAQWKVLGNQVVFSPLDLLGIIDNLDAWDGYTVERQKVVDHIVNNNIEDVVIITGDFHIGLAANATVDPATFDKETGEGAFAVEFVSPSVTTANADDIDLGLPSVDYDALAQLALNFNPHGSFVNMIGHGYYILDLNKEQAQADYYWIDTKVEPSESFLQEQSWAVAKGETLLKATTLAPEITDNTSDVPNSLEVVGIESVELPTEAPEVLILSHYPNPTKNLSEINYALARSQSLTVTLHDVTGRQVAVLLDQKNQAAGIYSLQINAEEMAKGIYFYQFKTAKGTISRKIIVQ